MRIAAPLLYAGIRPYVQIARPGHWLKNVLMLPGILLALYANPGLVEPGLVVRLTLGLFAACFIASSYYVLNEILDGPFDAKHPVKRDRPVPARQVLIPVAYAECALLALVGLGIARVLGTQFFATALVLCVMSLLYNVRPIRAKDRAYLDVLAESLNMPLRIILGWYATGTTFFIPLSIIMASWMLGAFFMTVKRVAEYKLIGDSKTAAAYRASFREYNTDKLLVSATFYAVAFGLFLGIFLVHYRLELLVAVPLIAGLMAWYIHLGLEPESPTLYPVRLYRERKFMGYLLLCAAIGILAVYVDMPWLREAFQPL